jgi:putative ABC transport system substrate-binding protein
MPERDVCLVVPASYWFEMQGERLTRTWDIRSGSGLLAAPLAAEAQQPGKVWRIGWLSPTSSLSGASELEALRQGLRELGYIEGRNLVIESRWADGEPAALPALARPLVEINVDVMCPAGTQATLAAKNATSKIPIIFAAAAFPDETGLVARRLLMRAGSEGD